MTGDEYVALLVQRRDAWEAEQPREVGAPSWLRALPEWFIEPGDEAMVSLPPEVVAPQTVRTPRHYRSAADLRTERDGLSLRLAAMSAGPLLDPAMVNLPLRLRTPSDAQIRRAVRLMDRIAVLDGRIARAQAREHTGTQVASGDETNERRDA